MTGEVWAVVGVGVALFGAILGQGYYLGTRIDKQGDRIDTLRSDLGGKIEALGERVAKLEGMFSQLPWVKKEDPKR